MPESAVRTFSDPDDYAASIRRSMVEMTVTARGQFTAKLVRIDLHRLLMQRASETLPRIWHCAAEPKRAYFTFRTHPGPSLFWGDAESQPSSIRRHIEHDAVFGRSSGLARHAAMSLPVEEMALLSATIGGCDLMPPKDSLTVTPAPHAMAKLQRLHAAAGRLAEDAPEVIAHPEAARGLEQALIEALVGCLADCEARETRLAQGQHAIVIRRFRRVVEENPTEPLFIPEVCKAIRVSQRTLLNCCQEHLGMGPKRYLLLRRMHLVRRALRDAAPDTTSVTDMATRYGFWQLGRFAVEYQSLFGESPSATLRRQPG
jgi:AraC-like DNA-binding protein